jgi:hypothetical protein
MCDELLDGNEIQFKMSCFHESGHAVGNYVCGFPPCLIEMEGDSTLPGYFVPHCKGIQAGCFRGWFEELFVLLSGAVAETYSPVHCIVRGSPLQSASSDIIQATLILNQFLGKPKNDPSGSKNQFGEPEYFQSAQSSQILKTLFQICEDVDTLFAEEDVTQGLHELAEQVWSSSRAQPRFGEEANGSYATYGTLDTYIKHRKDTVHAPDWFRSLSEEVSAGTFEENEVEEFWETIRAMK